jgi:hypothetical protein
MGKYKIFYHKGHEEGTKNAKALCPLCCIYFAGVVVSYFFFEQAHSSSLVAIYFFVAVCKTFFSALFQGFLSLYL